MAEGSRARFRGNEFALTHAVLDFTDRNKIAIALDVHGESQVRDYQVFMHVFGPLTDPQLTLTSAPAALAAGHHHAPLARLHAPRRGGRRRRAGRRHRRRRPGALLGLGARRAGEALPAARQVVRDLSVRITSAYSEVTGQVEPRAEFESCCSATGCGSGTRRRSRAPRGQKAQAELRLGRHTAVQYQWDNDNPDVATGDHGVDLKLRWEWTDE